MDFQEFPKIARLKREVIVTEKIDGANVAIVVTDDGEVLCQSRTKFITPQDDYKGFIDQWTPLLFSSFPPKER